MDVTAWHTAPDFGFALSMTAMRSSTFGVLFVGYVKKNSDYEFVGKKEIKKVALFYRDVRKGLL